MQRIVRKIAIVSIPTAGHIKSLIRLCQAMRESHSSLFITFILTSWSDYVIDVNDHSKLNEISDNLVILQSRTRIKRHDTYGRAIELSNEVIENCRDHHAIIYDFMTPEGYIAGHMLSLPVICVNPSFIASFNQDSDAYKKYMQHNKDKIESLEHKYQIKIAEHLQLISNQLSIQAPLNIIFSWSKFILSSAFTHHHAGYKYIFMRPTLPDFQLREFAYLEQEKHSGKKIIYFSLGTIVPGLALNLSEYSLLSFIKSVYDHLFNIASRRDDLLFILSIGNNLNDMIDYRQFPPNTYLYESVPQTQLLSYVDVFITHCGANSANESIDSDVPMIGIPIMNDEHECAERIHALGLGISFQHSPELRVKAIDFDADIYFRDSLTEHKLEDAIDIILNTNHFKENIKQIKSDENSTLTFQDMIGVLDRRNSMFMQKA